MLWGDERDGSEMSNKSKVSNVSIAVGVRMLGLECEGCSKMGKRGVFSDRVWSKRFKKVNAAHC